VEAFGGSGAVLFTKERAPLDVWNDVDAGLVTFMRALRDAPEALERALRFTPYSRAEWRECRETWETIADDVERARRWYVMVNQGFGAEPVATGWGSERTGAARIARAVTFATSIDALEAFAERWRGVQIESMDWRSLLERYDAPGACFYLDPPYMPETRASGGYRHEISTEDHVELIERAKALEGAVVLSGYDSPLYRSLESDGFERFEFPDLLLSRTLFGERAQGAGREANGTARGGLAARPGCRQRRPCLRRRFLTALLDRARA